MEQEGQGPVLQRPGDGRGRDQPEDQEQDQPASRSARTRSRSSARRTCRRRTKQIKACEKKLKGICGAIVKWHDVDLQTGEIGENPVEVGKQGWDRQGSLKRKGDSWVAERKGQTFTRKVTATPGKTLHFFCAVHPEMQGEIEVVELATSRREPRRRRDGRLSRRALLAAAGAGALALVLPVRPRPGGLGLPAARRASRAQFKRPLRIPRGAHRRRRSRSRCARRKVAVLPGREDEDVDLRRAPSPDRRSAAPRASRRRSRSSTSCRRRPASSPSTSTAATTAPPRTASPAA